MYFKDNEGCVNEVGFFHFGRWHGSKPNKRNPNISFLYRSNIFNIKFIL